MSLFVFFVVLFAALLHAIWNAVVKGGADTLLTTILVTTSAAAIGVVGLPFLPAPAVSSWPYAGASAALQIGYFLLVARIYRIADMGLPYPLMRGTAPLLVALASQAWLGEVLPARAWLGVGVISAGILVMALGGRRRHALSGAGLAILSAGFIAGFTLVDARGVRLSGAPAAYILWVFLLTGAPFAVWGWLARRRELVPYARRNWRAGLVGGAGTLGAYGLALWAMTRAPVAMVAALRETSIVFAAAIAVVVLKERIAASRVAAVGVIVAGVVILRLAS